MSYSHDFPLNGLFQLTAGHLPSGKPSKPKSVTQRNDNLKLKPSRDAAAADRRGKGRKPAKAEEAQAREGRGRTRLPGRPPPRNPRRQRRRPAGRSRRRSSPQQKKKGKPPGRPPRRGKKLRNHLRNLEQKLAKEGAVPVAKAIGLLKQMKRSQVRRDRRNPHVARHRLDAERPADPRHRAAAARHRQVGARGRVLPGRQRRRRPRKPGPTSPAATI